MIPSYILLMIHNLNLKVKDLVTYLSCVNKCNKIDIMKCILFLPVPRNVPISVAERSKAWVYGRSLAGDAGSNPTGIMAVYCECCVFWCRGLCDGPIPRPEASFRDKERQRWGCVHHWVWSGEQGITGRAKKVRKREMGYLICELVYDVSNCAFAMICSVYKQFMIEGI